MAETPVCEYLEGWSFTVRMIADGCPQVDKTPNFCGKVAVRRYATADGGWMHLCLHHAGPHAKYAEPCYAGEEG